MGCRVVGSAIRACVPEKKPISPDPHAARGPHASHTPRSSPEQFPPDPELRAAPPSCHTSPSTHPLSLLSPSHPISNFLPSAILPIEYPARTAASSPSPPRRIPERSLHASALAWIPQLALVVRGRPTPSLCGATIIAKRGPARAQDGRCWPARKRVRVVQRRDATSHGYLLGRLAGLGDWEGCTREGRRTEEGRDRGRGSGLEFRGEG